MLAGFEESFTFRFNLNSFKNQTIASKLTRELGTSDVCNLNVIAYVHISDSDSDHHYKRQ